MAFVVLDRCVDVNARNEGEERDGEEEKEGDPGCWKHVESDVDGDDFGLVFKLVGSEWSADWGERLSVDLSRYWGGKDRRCMIGNDRQEESESR